MFKSNSVAVVLEVGWISGSDGAERDRTVWDRAAIFIGSESSPPAPLRPGNSSVSPAQGLHPGASSHALLDPKIRTYVRTLVSHLKCTKPEQAKHIRLIM